MSEMNDIIKNGQLMPADLTAQIRDKYYHVDVDPFTKSKRLFFDNSGGSFPVLRTGFVNIPPEGRQRSFPQCR